MTAPEPDIYQLHLDALCVFGELGRHCRSLERRVAMLEEANAELERRLREATAAKPEPAPRANGKARVR